MDLYSFLMFIGAMWAYFWLDHRADYNEYKKQEKKNRAKENLFKNNQRRTEVSHEWF